MMDGVLIGSICIVSACSNQADRTDCYCELILRTWASKSQARNKEQTTTSKKHERRKKEEGGGAPTASNLRN